MGMGLIRFRTSVLWAISTIFFTGPQAFSLSEERPGTEGNYQRLSHEFVLTPRNEVSAYCESGDTLVKGECESSTERKDAFLYLDGTIQKDSGRTGWSCKARFMRADQDELRITAVAKCRKGNEVKALKTKTPGHPGV
jgi:hypothetical protein